MAQVIKKSFYVIDDSKVCRRIGGKRVTESYKSVGRLNMPAVARNGLSLSAIWQLVAVSFSNKNTRMVRV